MGIKNLNKILEKHSPSAFKLLPFSSFYSKRIAIDAVNFMFITWSISYKQTVNCTDVTTEAPDRSETMKLWLKQLQSFIRRLLSRGITPVFIFDGKSPNEKAETQKKRRESKQKASEKLAIKMDELSTVDILERTPDMIEDVRKLLRQEGYPLTSEINFFKSILEAIGIPILQATGEAEQLCSYLCIEGQVEAVYSTDTDNLTHGCPILITGITRPFRNTDTGNIEEHFEVVILKNILSETNFSFPMFVDLCIMCGCDYNTNIYRVGYITAYKLIQQWKSIDNLPSKYDISCLNHNKCRELFLYCKSTNLLSIPNLSLDIDPNNIINSGRDILEPFGLEAWLQELMTLYEIVPKPTSNPITRPPTKVKLMLNSSEPVQCNTSNKTSSTVLSNQSNSIKRLSVIEQFINSNLHLL